MKWISMKSSGISMKFGFWMDCNGFLWKRHGVASAPRHQALATQDGGVGHREAARGGVLPDVANLFWGARAGQRPLVEAAGQSFVSCGSGAGWRPHRDTKLWPHRMEAPRFAHRFALNCCKKARLFSPASSAFSEMHPFNFWKCTHLIFGNAPIYFSEI